MAYTSLPDALITVGKAIKREIFKTYIKDNLDDHETRLNSLEGSANQIIVFDYPIFGSPSASTLTGLDFWRVPFGFTITDAKVGIFEKGSLTGTLEMNVRKASSLDDTGAVSIFTTRPSINFGTASDYDESTNMVLDATNKNVSAGDWLILDISSLPSNGTLGSYTVYLIGESS